MMTVWIVLLVLTLIAAYEILRDPLIALVQLVAKKVDSFLLKLSDLLKGIASK